MSTTIPHTSLARTPLHSCHCTSKARMAPFGGWDMPIQYTSILQEHHHTRTKASVFDTCHMGEFFIDGAHACQDLNRIVTCDIESLPTGQCRYGFILNDTAGILDDTIIYRLSSESYMVIVNAGTCLSDATWIQEHLSATTHFHDVSMDTAKIDLQGPLSKTVLASFTKTTFDALKYFHFIKTRIADENIFVSRTGYTGEYGYELYFAASSSKKIWDLLTSHRDVRPAGLGARDTLRLEVGYPLYGQDLDDSKSPFEANAMRFVHRDKEFIGKKTLDQQICDMKQDPSSWHILTPLLSTSRRSPHHHDKIFANGQEVGFVTSGSFSPSLKQSIALGYILAPFTAPNTALNIQGDKATIPVLVTTLPFYKNGSVRKPLS